MEQDRGVAEWKRTAVPVRPDLAVAIASAVARQSASPTAQVITAARAGPVTAVSLVDLFGARRRRGPISGASFNTGVARLLAPGEET